MKVLMNGAEFEVDLTKSSISQISRIISDNWDNVNYAAVPYVAAMNELNTIDSRYGVEDGRSIVVYFLSNASTWKGEVAKAVKAELKRRLKPGR